MKKISNTIRIGMVPRAGITPKFTGEQSPPASEKYIHQIIKEEQLAAKNSPAISRINPYSDEQQVLRFTSPTNIRLQESREIHPNKQQSHTNGPNHHQPLSPSSIRQETVSELYEVPTNTKTGTQRKVLLGIATAVVIGAIVVVAVVLGVVLTRSNDTTSSSTSPTTTIAPTVISAVWPFDNVTTELYGVYNGSIMNGAIYSNATSQTFPYFGSGQALLLNGTNQFVSVTSPFLPLNATSFTIEAWIYPTSLTSDRGIFGQCQCSTCANQCLYFICRGNRLFIDFTLNDLSGSTNLAANTWHHVAFVYNYQTRQQILYLNGIQDAIKSNAAPFQGINASIQIGSTQAFGISNFFSGLIDNLWVTTRAKSADEILRDASLIVYFSFDLPNPNADNGPNKLSGTPSITVTVSGRVNQAMRFTGAGSYFQMYGLFQVPTGMTTNRPFSVSLWINPTAASTCTFVQLMSFAIPRCTNLLGISSSGGSIGQIFVQSINSAPATLMGPFVTQNVWTHLSITYGATNGFALYVNGIYFGATGTVVYLSGGTLSTLFVGYFMSCSGATFNTAYQGSIDEVYVHNRELTQADVTALANP